MIFYFCNVVALASFGQALVGSFLLQYDDRLFFKCLFLRCYYQETSFFYCFFQDFQMMRKMIRTALVPWWSSYSLWLWLLHCFHFSFSSYGKRRKEKNSMRAFWSCSKRMTSSSLSLAFGTDLFNFSILTEVHLSLISFSNYHFGEWFFLSTGHHWHNLGIAKD